MQDEKIFKTVSSVSIWSLVLGIISVIGGTLLGTAMIVNGARLIKKKSKMLF